MAFLVAQSPASAQGAASGGFCDSFPSSPLCPGPSEPLPAAGQYVVEGAPSPEPGPPGQVLSSTATCDPEDEFLYGGHRSENVTVTAERPVDAVPGSGIGWQVEGVQTSGDAAQYILQAFAVCSGTPNQA